MQSEIKIGDLFKIRRGKTEGIYIIMDYNPHVPDYAYLGLERADKDIADNFRCAWHYLSDKGHPVGLEELQEAQKENGKRIWSGWELGEHIKIIDAQVKRRNQETEKLKKQREEEKSKKASEGNFNKYKPY